MHARELPVRLAPTNAQVTMTIHTTFRSPIQQEIAALEEQLRLAELGPDPAFFVATLSDDVVLVQNGNEQLTKQQVVDGHRPHGGPKFVDVQTRDLRIVEHGDTAVVSCEGVFTLPDGKIVSLDVMRVWHRADRWQIIAASIIKR